jgi:hypothetical protein
MKTKRQELVKPKKERRKRERERKQDGRNPRARPLEKNRIINYAIEFCHRGKRVLAHSQFDKP